jgi:hypothetical protein
MFIIEFRNQSDMKNNKILQIGNIIGFISVLLVNILANSLPINDITTGELSDLYPNLFVPAGYVFSIWFIIYLLLLAFSLYQASPSRIQADFIEKIGYYFIISCIANVSWILLWHYKQVFLSLIAMLGILASLIMVYLRLDIGRKEVSRNDWLFTQLPFSVYLGWITVATIANVVALLVNLNWGRFGISEVTWTMLMISVAVLLTLININIRMDLGYVAVILWAFGGIIVKQMAIQKIVYTAGLGMIVLISYFIYKKISA